VPLGKLLGRLGRRKTANKVTLANELGAINWETTYNLLGCTQVHIGSQNGHHEYAGWVSHVKMCYECYLGKCTSGNRLRDYLQLTRKCMLFRRVKSKFWIKRTLQGSNPGFRCGCPSLYHWAIGPCFQSKNKLQVAEHKNFHEPPFKCIIAPNRHHKRTGRHLLHTFWPQHAPKRLPIGVFGAFEKNTRFRLAGNARHPFCNYIEWKLRLSASQNWSYLVCMTKFESCVAFQLENAGSLL
jgi:hypothetical protein